MRRGLLPLLLLAISIAFLAAGSFPARADRQADGQKLGQSWRKLSSAFDQAYETMQKDAGITPAPLANDDVWLRRVYLDLTGAPPSVEEIEDFDPGDGDPASRRSQLKREKLIDDLLESDDFLSFMAELWTTILTGRNTISGRSRLESYLYMAFKFNLPWNDVVRGLFAATPGMISTPEYGFLYSLLDLNDLAYVAGRTSRVLLGRQIECAQCHDGPYGKWTQSDFEAWQGFFKSFIDERERENMTYLRIGEDMQINNRDELIRELGLKGEYKLPRYLDGTEWKPGDADTLREAMADWLSGKNNPWFAEMTVNRYLAYFMGIGFVNPVDDFNAYNTATIPVIMKVMGEDFVASGYDLKYLIRALLNTRAYQRASTTNESNHNDRMYHSHQHVRELSRESVMRSIIKVTGVERLNDNARRHVSTTAEEQEVDQTVFAYKTRISRLMASAWDGTEPAVKPVGEHGSNLFRALMFMSGDILPRGLNHSVNETLEMRLKRRKQRIKRIFMTAMGRRPSEKEMELMRETVKDWSRGKRSPPAEVYEDLFLSLLSSPEFINRT